MSRQELSKILTRPTVVLSSTGVVLASGEFPTTRTGYRATIGWARSHGVLSRAGVEGTGSYEAALTRLLRTEGVQVLEVNRPDRSVRRRRGKSDVVDAEAAARAVLAGAATAVPKTADGPVEALRLFKTAKDSAVKARVQAVNQLKAVLVGVDPAMREALAALPTGQLIQHCAELDLVVADDVTAATLHTLRHLARRIRYLAADPRPTAAHRRRGRRRGTATSGGQRHRARCRGHLVDRRRRQSTLPQYRGVVRCAVWSQPDRGLLGQV
jgi:transposase